jgi:calmodulin
MEMASSSAPTTSYYNVSVGQAVLTLSINAILVWLTTFIKSSSSAASSVHRREAVPAAAPAPSDTAPPSPSSPAKPAAAAVDMDVVLGLMGAGGAGAVSVGFEEAAALFEEEEATEEEAREAFAVFDRNGDGFIDAAELRSVLTSLGFQAGVAEAECQRMIDVYDGDRDGRIDFLEFVKLMQTSH